MKLQILVLTMLPLLTVCGESPTQKFQLRITDEDDKPMAGVTGKAWFNKVKEGGSSMDSYLVTGVTNQSGIVELQGETLHYQTAIGAEFDGYYPASKGALWMKEKSGNHWLPSPVKEKLTLKKMATPHPMCVAKFNAHKWLSFPDAKLGPMGFDLEIGDWVAPDGKGKIADFILEGVREELPTNLQNPKCRIVLTFTNEFDGILGYDDSGGSEYVGPILAPDKMYKNKWEFPNWSQDKSRPERISRDFTDESYVFRVRTRVDKNGKIIEAYYGKIDGRIRGWLIERAPGIMFTYYFNNKANERSLEWDMKTNLIRDLPEQNWPQNP